MKTFDELSVNKIKENILGPYSEILNAMNEVYIFGAKNLGQKLANEFKSANYKVLGFIDNNKNQQGQILDGLKIFAPQELTAQKNSVIIVASINYVKEISAQLKEMGFSKIIPYHILAVFNKNIFSAEPSFDGLYEDFLTNKDKYDWLFDLLEDEKSKTVLNKIIEFRQSYDMNLYDSIKDDIEKQYFEAFAPYNGEPFVDGGAFDGDTVERFLNIYNDYEKIYFFEPDEKSFEVAKEKLKNVKNIEFYMKGLSDCKQTLKFDSRGNLGSLLSDEGDIEIECTELDGVVKEEKAFIKLDVEGAEIDALKGAERLIKNNSTLAVCVYHKPSDIWQIPQMILEINRNYKFYLRHYTGIVFDTILYAIPRSNK